MWVTGAVLEVSDDKSEQCPVRGLLNARTPSFLIAEERSPRVLALLTMSRLPGLFPGW
jgi:hypothetical protein